MKQNGKINVGVYGASGYTGFEAINILRKHQDVRLVFATSENSAGKSIGDIYPVTWDVPLVAAADAPLSKVDAAFCCLICRRGDTDRSRSSSSSGKDNVLRTCMGSIGMASLPPLSRMLRVEIDYT